MTNDLPQTIHTEWACMERGFEDQVEWTTSRSAAEADLFATVPSGLDVFLATREVRVMPWREVQP